MASKAKDGIVETMEVIAGQAFALQVAPCRAADAPIVGEAQVTAKHHLFAAAEEQRNEMLRVIRAVVENAGWRFEDKVSSSEVRSRIEERSPDAPIPSPVHAP